MPRPVILASGPSAALLRPRDEIVVISAQVPRKVRVRPHRSLRHRAAGDGQADGFANGLSTIKSGRFKRQGSMRTIVVDEMEVILGLPETRIPVLERGGEGGNRWDGKR